ncbi:MAG: ribosome-associated translation inhibitor RaiA [Acidobacteria bacterium]|nr:ribosome-associated translation inhibitor RaiA [Acidobacteriota bacterium]
MRVEITGRHIEVTPALRKFVQQHIGKIPKVLGDHVGIHVILAVEKKRNVCDIILTSKTFQLACAEETSDMYTSISKAVSTMERQVLKQKKRRVELKRRKRDSVRRGPAAPPKPAPAVIEEAVSKKPMVIEEALLNLGRAIEGVVVYRDADSNGVSVLYRRKDGNIGLIRA